MAQLKRVVEPFGEVNVFPESCNRLRVRATILAEPHREGTQTGIALDGSGSMSAMYGVEMGGGLVSSMFGKKSAASNQISPVAQKLCAYLARRIDADGGTTCIYWATGPGGASCELVGDLTAGEAEGHFFGPPKKFGTGTKLVPAVEYFVNRFADAPFGFYVFITDGEIHDMPEVKVLSQRLAKEVASGRRQQLKFVLIGLGDSVNEKQLAELDDLDTGEVDLWDHKLARELRQLEQIFAEVVSANAIVTPKAAVLDSRGNTVKDFSAGLPAKFEFVIDAASPYFTLEIPGHRVHQGLSDGAKVPESIKSLDGDITPTAEVAFADEPVPPPQALPKTPPQVAAEEDTSYFKLEMEKDRK